MKKNSKEQLKSKILNLTSKVYKAREELKKAIVGQEHIVSSIFKAIICNGHILIEGVPGIAKTLIIKSVSTITDTKFSRIQFTPDLLPTDIVGLTVYRQGQKKGKFETIKGPIFGNFILGDEINRASQKVQSAMLEAMQEKQVTIGKNTFPLDNPFIVLATQNPIESLGTYTLPAAQLDRFLFKIKMGYPGIQEEEEILERNMTTKSFKSFDLKPIIKKEDIIEMQEIVHDIYLDDKIKKYIVRIVDATRNHHKYNIKLGKYIEFGGSPRASIALYIASKAEALLNGKSFVIPEDVKTIAYDVLRHRIMINYEGQSENIQTETIIDEILSKVAIP